MPKSTLAIIALVAFLTPLAVVAFQQRDAIRKHAMLEPWEGQLLYFTSPM